MTWKECGLEMSPGSWRLDGSPIPTTIEPHWNNDNQTEGNRVWHLSVGPDRETCYGGIDVARRRCEWLLLDMAQSWLKELREMLGEEDDE